MKSASLLVAIILSPVVATPVLATLHSGIGVLVPGVDPAGWDFSAQMSVPVEQADIIVVTLKAGGTFVFGLHGTTLAVLQEPFANVTEAPADMGLYESQQPVSEVNPFDTTYIVFTPEGHFAKFKFVNINFPTIEYAYQDDGSRILAPVIPVETVSWGQIKILYE